MQRMRFWQPRKPAGLTVSTQKTSAVIDGTSRQHKVRTWRSWTSSPTPNCRMPTLWRVAGTLTRGRTTDTRDNTNAATCHPRIDRAGVVLSTGWRPNMTRMSRRLLSVYMSVGAWALGECVQCQANAPDRNENTHETLRTQETEEAQRDDLALQSTQQATQGGRTGSLRLIMKPRFFPHRQART